VGALGLAGLAVVSVFVAQLGWSAGAHQPTVFEWVLQGTVLVVGGILILRRMTGKT
jgi:hypothetical protein